MRLRLVRTPDSRTASALLVRIRAGEDFAAVARAVSVDSSAKRGGDLGWVVPADLSEPLRSIVATLGKGEVSAVVETARGYVIVKRER